MTKKKRKLKGKIFITVIAAAYLLLYFFYPKRTYLALTAGCKIFLTVLPIIVIVIVFTAVMNYFVSPGKISKYLGKNSGFRGWLIVSGAGILSHGAIYLWYDFLRKLREKGMSRGLAAVFLYNRAIKIPLIPVMVHYFGISFVIVLTVYTIAGSYTVGLVMNSLKD